MLTLSDELRDKFKKMLLRGLRKIVIDTEANEKAVNINCINKEDGEQELFREAVDDLKFIFNSGDKGPIIQLKKAKMISDCIKRINEFCKVSKNKKHEADLLMMVLKEAFSVGEENFGTCFTAFDYKVALLLKRLMTLVSKRLHDDYKMDYKKDINRYLKILKKTSIHNVFVYKLPDKF